MKKCFIILLLLMLLALPACRMRSEHKVIVAGSTSVQLFAEILAEAYVHDHDGEEIDVQGGGSSAGIMAAESGAAEIGMSSRALKDGEKGLWSVEIAKDGLAIIVHPSNPINDLSIEQVKKIYAREITNWSEVGGANAAIHIIAREDGSGTRSAFEELVMGLKTDNEREIALEAVILPSNGAIRQFVSGDAKAIGFISLGLVEGEKGDKPVKAVALGGVPATRENVSSGDYALFRPFLFIAREQPTGAALEFIDYVLSPQGQEIMAGEGLITK